MPRTAKGNIIVTTKPQRSEYNSYFVFVEPSKASKTGWKITKKKIEPKK
ncbi:hypothetical protein HY989_01405 [Candidatus Micrarchaeota archaeon]|nr:hypothetical protein [Candidatus Micrarchaeota archaeon]